MEVKEEIPKETEEITSSQTKEIKAEIIGEKKEEKKEEKEVEQTYFENNDKVFKTKNKKTLKFVFLGLTILLLLVFFMLGFAIFNMNNTNIISGVKVRDISIQGLSKEQAFNILTEYLGNEENNEINIYVNDKLCTITPLQIEARYKIEEAVNEAYQIGRKGNIIEKNFEILKTMINGIDLDLQFEYNEELLDVALEDIKSKIDGALVESSYRVEDDKLVITRGKEGLSIDEEKTKETILNEIKKGTYGSITLETILEKPSEIDIEKIHEEIFSEPKDAYYTTEPFEVFAHETGIDFDIEEAKKILEEDKEEYIIPLIVTNPEVTTNEIGTEAFPDLLASFKTTYSESNVSRSKNLKLAAKKISGTILSPGETFSYNGVVGERTVEAGFDYGNGFVGGKVVPMIGGGICQVSSTLYNSVIFANLDIVERHNHMFLAGYVGAGRDATVVYGSLDFRFKNTRKYPIMIKANAQGGVLKVEIYGTKEEVEYDVEFATTILNYYSYKTIYEDDATLKQGKTKITQSGMNGCKSITYKVLKLDGKEISREVLSTDSYSAMNQYVSRGTKGSKTETTAKPSTSTETEKEPTTETTPETTPEETPETTPETNPETKPEETPETTPDTTPETTPDATPETTPETTPNEDSTIEE